MKYIIENMEVFFNETKNMIEKENNDLYELIIENKQRLNIHKSISPNFYFLSNASLAYLIYKRILTVGWRYEISLQERYPNKNVISELLIKKDLDIIGTINLIRWNSLNPSEIKLLLQNFRLINKKIKSFAFIFWLEEINDNYLEWLKIDLNNYFDANLISNHSFLVKDFDFYIDKEIQRKAVLSLFEINAK